MAKAKLGSRLTAKEKFWGIVVLVAILAVLLALLTLKDFLIAATPSLPFMVEAAEPGEALLNVLHAYYRNLFLPAGGLLAGVMLIYAGIVYASSAGEPGRISLAKELMAGAILGFVLLISVGFVVANITPPESLRTPPATPGGNLSPITNPTGGSPY